MKLVRTATLSGGNRYVIWRLHTISSSL